MNQSWHQFFAMGGYARYVWSAYGIAAVVLLVNIVAPVVAHRRIKRRIRNEQFEDD
ncbi:MAG: heme exporter protein CcmD [Salinisphaera sp.]|jgi:heme exporter protein D|nr:heme exporter protein CcmD [Salinisphaera sp.]